jgi:hypothetical protein
MSYRHGVASKDTLWDQVTMFADLDARSVGLVPVLNEILTALSASA